MTPKQERFCQEIVKGQSQADAYRVAYKPKRMSKKTVIEKASRLMRRGNMKARVIELTAPVIAQTRLTAERWQLELDRCALGDVRKMFDTHGNPLDIHALGDDEAPCVAGFEILEEFEGRGADRTPIGYTRKYKLVDKLRALELAGKTRGYYVEKKEVTARVTLEALVLASMEVHDAKQ